jgi:hypothetical protein
MHRGGLWHRYAQGGFDGASTDCSESTLRDIYLRPCACVCPCACVRVRVCVCVRARASGEFVGMGGAWDWQGANSLAVVDAR